jgi:ferrochelatase
MTYGSPASLDRPDVATYLARVRGGREPADELVDEFARRYERIGGSPLIAITRAQAVALERHLGWPVDIGMRFSAPSIGDGLAELAARGVGRVAAIVLSPQFSTQLMGGYRRAIDEALLLLGGMAPVVTLAGAWHDEPSFVAALAERIRESLSSIPAAPLVPVLLTAHSLPRRVAEQEPEYLRQLEDTANLVAGRAALASRQWRFCWQSAGHEPGAWMSPDFADLMPELARDGQDAVLVAPLQFLADHLEVLYDIDIGAREQAEQTGLRFARTRSLNDDPGLIRALASVSRRTVNRAGTSRLSPASHGVSQAGRA